MGKISYKGKQNTKDLREYDTTEDLDAENNKKKSDN